MPFKMDQLNSLEDIKALENFISENKDLEYLESIVNQFNIFTSLRIEFLEIRHSNFLSWLLDPNETHGLGAYFLEILLKRFARTAKSLQIDTVSLIDIDYWDLDSAVVLREWNKIDLLIRDDRNKFVCVIENKINSFEHEDQLQRYFKLVSTELSDYKKMFVYLTIAGESPEIDNSNTWIPIGYGQVVESIDYLLESKKNTFSDDINIFISHYLEMLRRYIMQDSKVQELCRRIYSKHKRAIDLIIESKPDRLNEISEILQEIIYNDSDLILDNSSKTYIRFIPKNLDFISRVGSGWTTTKRILLFEIQNRENGVVLILYIGPGNDELRKKIYDIASDKPLIFKSIAKKFTEKWTAIYKEPLMKAEKYESMDNEELKSVFEDKIKNLKEKDILNIVRELTAFKNELSA